ncbi:MAG: hypothetical protein U1E55_03075 [Paracoccus sp. (in: a-proteobacteria)]
MNTRLFGGDFNCEEAGYVWSSQAHVGSGLVMTVDGPEVPTEQIGHHLDA